MSQYARQHPEKIGTDPRLHVPGLGAPKFDDDGCTGPEPPRRKLTDSRHAPWGGYWTIEDVCVVHRDARVVCRRLHAD